MKIEQIYTGCLAQGAYYIVSENEAIIIDPLRETKPYIERAKQDGVQIKYILETHFHADFVSGHLDLAKKTGAKIVYGPTAAPNFDFYAAKDGEEIALGKIKDIKIQNLYSVDTFQDFSKFIDNELETFHIPSDQASNSQYMR